MKNSRVIDGYVGWFMSKLNQAVLIQFAGLVCLFAVGHPYNLLGWALILVGGILYRQELKRRKALKTAVIVQQSAE
jgi:hypothetical protein